MRLLTICILFAFLLFAGCGEDKEKKDEVVDIEQNSATQNAVLSPQDIAILNAWNPGESKGNEVWTLTPL